MQPIVSVQGLGKKYVIRHEGQNTTRTLRDEISTMPKRLFTAARPKEDFWALKDVNFDIMQGDRVGIIGRNGAGKSTLLKLLSRITEPTTGRITIHGRVASLLEVGTGFHPELTGRENIYLNGAILGMPRAEISAKFDEIVDFSGVEQFLDTPVKRYSSGMYVRLAFAIAAHLEPEILVVDEVLAVGDAEFQKKCLGKMQQVSQGEGRTVLFVSHNMAAVRQLCNRGILLKHGKIIENSTVEHTLQKYLDENYLTSFIGNVYTLEHQPIDDTFQFNSVEFIQNKTSCSRSVNGEEQLFIKIKYIIKKHTSSFRLYFDILDEYNTILMRTFNDRDHIDIKEYIPGVYTTTFIIPPNLLGPRCYEIAIHGTLHNIRNCSYVDGIRNKFNVMYTRNCNGPFIDSPFVGYFKSQIKIINT